MANERDTFAQVAHTQERQKQKAINRVLEGNMTMDKMEEKLKAVKLKASEKIQLAIERYVLNVLRILLRPTLKLYRVIVFSRQKCKSWRLQPSRGSFTSSTYVLTAP